MRRVSSTDTSQTQNSHMSKATRLTTPPCEVRWANVLEPNYKYATMQDARGTFSIQAILDPSQPAHKNFLDDLRAEWDNGYADYCRTEKKKALTVHDFPWTAVKDDDGLDTGLVAIRPKNKESFTGKEGEKVDVEITIKDAKNQNIKVEIGNGSICKVRFEVNPFYHAAKYGLQLRLKAVQVLSLVTYEGSDGFEEEESGYVGTPVERTPRAVHAPVAAEPAPVAAQTNFASNDDEAELPFS